MTQYQLSIKLKRFYNPCECRPRKVLMKIVEDGDDDVVQVEYSTKILVFKYIFVNAIDDEGEGLK